MDLLSGRIETAPLNLSAAMSHVKAGKLRAIAMATKRRSDAMPDLGTIDEAGVRGYDAGTWWALFGPANLPRGVVNMLHAAMVKVVSDAGARARLAQQHGAETTLLGPDELLAHLRAEHAVLGPIIRKLRLRME